MAMLNTAHIQSKTEHSPDSAEDNIPTDLKMVDTAADRHKSASRNLQVEDNSRQMRTVDYFYNSAKNAPVGLSLFDQ